MIGKRRVNVIIKSGVRITGLPKELKEMIKKDLTFKNKVYDDAVRFGRWISQDTLPKLSYWYEDKASGQFMVPKGYTRQLLQMLRDNGLGDYRIRDETYFLKKENLIDFKFNGEMRPYQEEAVNDLLAYPNGVLEAKTGAGKTAVGIYMIYKRQQPTLVIVHSKELLHQWRAQIKKFLGIEAGIIGDGKMDVRTVTVGIVNSVRANIKDIRRSFGFTIVDETHRTPSTLFTDALMFLQSKYTLGLSATPFRNDGLDLAINAFIGPLLHKVSPTMLHKIGAVLKPEIFFVSTKFYTPKTDYKSIIAELTKNEARNVLISKVAMADIQRQNQTILIAVDRVSMGTDISKILSGNGFKNHFLHGTIPDADRSYIVRSIKKGDVKVLIATIALIGEGFDVPGLHSLLLAAPIKYEGKVIQIVGRILRPEDGKTARLYDFRDDGIGILQRHGVARLKVYKEQGWITK